MITLESLISTVCLDVLNVVLISYFFLALNGIETIVRKFYLFLDTLLYIVIHMTFFNRQFTILIDFILILLLTVQTNKEKCVKYKTIVLIFFVDLFCEFVVYYAIVCVLNVNTMIVGMAVNDMWTVFRIILARYSTYVILFFFLYNQNKLSDINIKIFKYISFGVSIFYGLTVLSYNKELLFYHDEVGRIFIFTLVLYNTVLVIFNYYQNMHIRTVNKLETLKQNRSYQGKYWKDYYENYAAIRKTKHDMLNGYIGLYGLVKEERYDELKLYLESSIKNLKEMESVHYFGNPLIDAIVSKKISDAKERGIEVVFHCGVISIGDIDEEDLGILLANALDNAIESTVKSSYDKIDVYVSTMNCFLKIDVINYVDDITGVSFKNTSKVFDKENHGIGIKSMKDTAKKYNGSLQYDKKDNEVILSVIMNIN